MAFGKSLSRLMLGLGLFEFLSAFQFLRDSASKIREHDGIIPGDFLDKPPVKATWCSYLVTLGCVRIVSLRLQRFVFSSHLLIALVEAVLGELSKVEQVVRCSEVVDCLRTRR